ncbi:methionyl-tRNA formyltransferase [Marinicella rhabdoformis]|uniref:methionyl-tRNA formyltransferase n=1 Tax=Marinicella rhabdoformis TaxID=2580566 RepID=UPI0012AECF6F|nr:methionyl-tRNA formyltransferase [Marinicella rhabdoformis]
MNIIFCGTPDFSVTALQHLINAGHHIQAVFTQPDKPKGRGQKEQKTPVKLEAEKHDIPVFQPINLKSEVTQELLASFKCDLMVVVAYGLIIPQVILDMPKHGCWNIHASILPRWRGAAPIHRAILAGDKKTGISIMQMEAGLDTGPVYRIYSTDIDAQDTAQTLHDRLSDLGGKAIVDCIQSLENKTLGKAEPQNNNLATYAHKLQKSESVINWHQPAAVIERQIRAFTPWPGSSCEVAGEGLKIWQAEVVTTNNENTKNSGDIAFADKKQLHIQCHPGQLSLLEIQKPGKKRMPITALMVSKPLWYT